MTEDQANEQVSVIAPEFLSRVVCPVTRSALRQEGAWLVAAEGGRRYPIRNGIPVLLAEAAEMTGRDEESSSGQ